MPTETELKLRLDAAGMRRLRRHRLIARLKRARPTTRFMKSVYFDTPDFRLYDLQMVLRVRHLGRRRLQTIKDMGEMIGGVRARGEWESEITGDTPEIGQIGDETVPPQFADARLWRALQPVFTSEIRRTVYHLSDEDWEIELALDEGLITTSQDSIPVCEAELELKRGQPKHLFDLALALQRDLPFIIETATKAGRGYDLLTGRKRQHYKADPLKLAATLSAAEAFRLIAHSCLAHFLANYANLDGGPGAETIHQMRVALRRLRSAIGIFKDFLDTAESRWLKEELRWLLTPLGAARDGDVFFDEIFAPLTGILDDEPGFHLLQQDLTAERRAAYTAAQELLKTPRLTHLLLRLGRWIEAGDWQEAEGAERRSLLDMPIRDLAETTLNKLERKAGRGMRHLSEDDETGRHTTRIHIKKLRYSIDFFESLFRGIKSRKLVEHLGALQDRLGLLHDIAVGRQRLARHGETAQDSGRLWAAGMIAGWHLARVDDLVKQSIKDWRRFDKQARPWKR
ncbi:CYTH and CHAD domain-containing protein [Telmatospirillum siberiense]|nr:CYTH and CHAD domain-containing protein [Telmatospirillum siberiense]